MECSECSTEIILQQSERQGLILALDCHHFMKCEEKLSKYESNEYNRSKSHIFNSEQKKRPLIIYLSQETINVANHALVLLPTKLKFVNFVAKIGLNFNRLSLNSQR